eukprot:CAMPEP_0119216646 /NCGR_PEP_ID=MMETSP1327-20130426/15859_1 /TAXON_ID=38833 /ORGANISM="Micromonas pusilla, Strain RCC2306" /LENGTH=131 /DNA_ID=CAMNT_0007214573 /DNA_START=242 /DNA_END=637 /DNA_ORIENTATION=+
MNAALQRAVPRVPDVKVALQPGAFASVSAEPGDPLTAALATTPRSRYTRKAITQNNTSNRVGVNQDAFGVFVFGDRGDAIALGFVWNSGSDRRRMVVSTGAASCGESTLLRVVGDTATRRRVSLPPVPPLC